jgi:hypothetical protein
MKVKVVKNFISKEVAQIHAQRMDENKFAATYNDRQVADSWSFYRLHWDLLEDCCDKMMEETGLELAPTYDYCRIYKKGNILEKHSDRPSCEVSLTLNLKNVNGKWNFFWEGGSYCMNETDGVIYPGCDVLHWRDENPADLTYQVFLHYVNLNGPHASHANEYLTRRLG